MVNRKGLHNTMKNLKDEIEEILKKNTTWVSELELQTNVEALTSLIEQEKEKVLRGFVEHLGKKYELIMWLNEDIEQYLAERKEVSQKSETP